MAYRERFLPPPPCRGCCGESEPATLSAALPLALTRPLTLTERRRSADRGPMPIAAIARRRWGCCQSHCRQAHRDRPIACDRCRHGTGCRAGCPAPPGCRIVKSVGRRSSFWPSIRGSCARINCRWTGPSSATPDRSSSSSYCDRGLRPRQHPCGRWFGRDFAASHDRGTAQDRLRDLFGIHIVASIVVGRLRWGYGVDDRRRRHQRLAYASPASACTGRSVSGLPARTSL